MIHPENKEAFNKLYIKISEANPTLEHNELLKYTDMIFRSAMKADTEMFKQQYMGHVPDESEMIECEDCKGIGGYDAATDCEIYDEWVECPMCNGTGERRL